MRSFFWFLVSAIPAFAELPPAQDEERERPAEFDQVAAPCLTPSDPDAYVVTWWIEDKATGEKRAVDSQVVRLRC